MNKYTVNAKISYFHIYDFPSSPNVIWGGGVEQIPVLHDIYAYLLSLCEIVPFSNFDEIDARTLHASFAKSKSLTSIGETDINANASLSSFTVAHPT